jgi:hypothetical protein
MLLFESFYMLKKEGTVSVRALVRMLLCDINLLLMNRAGV